MKAAKISPMSGQRRFAVLVAAYNGINWINEQLTSILLQENIELSIFISVDESTDDTFAWCQDLAATDDRVKVLHPNGHFGGAAKNFFRLFRDVDFSDYDFVALADQDDIWLSDKLLRAHKMLLKTGADAYSSNVIAFWQDGRQQLIEKSQTQARWDFLFEAAGPGCTYVFRAGLARAIQGLLKRRWTEVQEVGLHDWFFYAYARANGHPWFIDDCPGMLYRQHEKNQVGVNMGWRAYLHRARKVLGGWGLAQSVLIAELVGLRNDPFVRQWSNGNRAGLLSLSLHAWQCRRRLRDKIMFGLSCAALFLAGKRRT